MQYILTENEEKIASEWEKYKGFTVRPLPSTIHYYEKWIRSYSNNNQFLLFGGTPEIRTVFQKLKLDLLMIDRSEKIVNAMGLLTKEKTAIASNEHFLKSDWLHLFDIENEKIDVMVSDDAINMVEFNHFDLFLKKSHGLLKNNGLFICHLLVKPEDNLINKDFFEVLNEYKQGSIKSIYDLASRLNFICFDKTSYMMGWQKTIKIIGEEKLALFKPHFDFLEIFRFCNSQFCCPPQNQFEELAKKYFKIKEIFYPHEHEYCLFEPVYLLEKNGENYA